MKIIVSGPLLLLLAACTGQVSLPGAAKGPAAAPPRSDSLVLAEPLPGRKLRVSIRAAANWIIAMPRMRIAVPVSGAHFLCPAPVTDRKFAESKPFS